MADYIDRQAVDIREEQKWIPVSVRPAEGEELKYYAYMFTCEMPEDEEEILVTVRSTHGNHVEKDVNYIDDCFHLDSGYDWQDDIAAWMPLPEPYKEGEQDSYRKIARSE